MRFRSHSSRIGTAVFVLLLVVGLTTPLFVAADSKEPNEPNDVQAAATPVTGTSIDGELTKKGGVDWYSKEFSAGDTVSFAVTKPLWDQGLEISLHAPNGTELDNTTVYQGVGKAVLSATASQSGEYGLKIEPISEAISGMQYTIHTPASEAPTKEPIELESGTQQENESNDNRSKAQPIIKKEITGEFSDTDDIDWYTVPVKEGQKVSILFTKEESESDMPTRIYTPGVYKSFEGNITYKDIKDEDTRAQMVIPVEQNGSLNIHLESGLVGSIEPFGYEIQITKTQQSDSSSGSRDGTTDNTNTLQSSGPNTPTEESDSQSKTQRQNTETSTTTTTDEEESTSLFGPGFTGPAALVALFVTALFALRRRDSV